MRRVVSTFLLSCLLLASRVALPAAAPPSVINFRDVGGVRTSEGYCVRRGLAFRSGNFATTTHEDGSALTSHYGLHVYYDLRSTQEAERRGAPTALTEAGVHWQALPMDSGDDPFFRIHRPLQHDWTAFYLRTLHRHGPAFAQLLRALAANDVPAVYGCSLGKDRTGIATALLLGALGVPTDVIVADYSASTAGLSQQIDRFQESWERMGLSRDDFVAYYLNADPRIVRDFLTTVLRQYGSFPAALREIGLTDLEQQMLRQRFLDANDADCRESLSRPPFSP